MLLQLAAFNDVMKSRAGFFSSDPVVRGRGPRALTVPHLLLVELGCCFVWCDL